MTRLDKAISAGPVAIRAELERQEAIYARQVTSYTNARPRSRFAVKAQMTKTENKVRRLQRALDQAGNHSPASAVAAAAPAPPAVGAGTGAAVAPRSGSAPAPTPEEERTMARNAKTTPADITTAVGRRANSEARQAARVPEQVDLLKALVAEAKALGLKAVKAAPSPNGKNIRLLAGKDTLAWLGAQTRNGMVVKPRLTAADIKGKGLKGFKPYKHAGPGYALIATVTDEAGVKTAAAALVLAQEKLAAK